MDSLLNSDIGMIRLSLPCFHVPVQSRLKYLGEIDLSHKTTLELVIITWEEWAIITDIK